MSRVSNHIFILFYIVIASAFFWAVSARKSRKPITNPNLDQRQVQEQFNHFVAIDTARSALFYDSMPFFFYDKKPPGFKCPKKRKDSANILVFGDSIDRFAVIDGCKDFNAPLQEWGTDFDYRTPGNFLLRKNNYLIYGKMIISIINLKVAEQRIRPL